MINSFGKNRLILTDVFKSGVLVLEVTADINVVVSDSSPDKAFLVASRSGGLVQTEVEGTVQIRLNVVVDGDGTRKKLFKTIALMEKLLSEGT